MSTNPAALPVVCDLSVFSPEQRKAHIELTQRVFMDWATRHESIEDGLLIVVEGDEARFLEVARWASEEHQCCAWLTFTVTITSFPHGTAGRIELRLTSATDEGQAFVGAAIGQLLAQGIGNAEQRKAG